MRRIFQISTIVGLCLLGLPGCQSDKAVSPTEPKGEGAVSDGAFVIPPGGQAPSIPCIAVYAPVCTEGFVTYSSKCSAEAAGKKILFYGACPRIGRPPKVFGK